MTDDSTWEAVARFYAGESTPEESAAVRAWLEAHPEQAAALRALDHATGKLVAATPADLDVEAALRTVTARRDAADVVPIGRARATRRAVRPTGPPRHWLRLATLAAASILLAVGARTLWHSASDTGYPVPPSAQTFATAVGQRDTVRLPDGTRVVLAPETRMIMAAGYGNDERAVELEGEAYFDVVHDEAHPFIVRAAGADIRDLGTTFAVSATEGAGVRVAVTSGSVSLAPAGSAPNAAVVLNPGDAGTLGTDGRALVERGGVAEADTAWARGRLVFREASVATVRAELRRWYGIDLRMDPSFAAQHFSMTFDGESADRVLEVIALSLGGEVTRQGNTAVIKPAAARAR